MDERVALAAYEVAKAFREWIDQAEAPDAQMETVGAAWSRLTEADLRFREATKGYVNPPMDEGVCEGCPG
jgi:hypothetical protein